MVLEACAAAAAKAMISRIAGSTASVLVARTQDEKALYAALSEALRRTDASHGALLARYDVNAGFFEHEGAHELARVLLPGCGPDPRRLARAHHRSLGIAEADADILVEPFGSLLADLRELLGRHERFRTALSQVAPTRSDAGTELDERELLEWTGRVFAYLRTAGLGGVEHVQLRLDEVFVGPRGLRERHGGRKWSTPAEEQRALLDDRWRNNEITCDEYESLLDHLAFERRGDSAPSEIVDVIETIKNADRVVVLGDPGFGKTTLMKYLAVRHAAARLYEDQASRMELGVARLPLYVRAGDFARSPSSDTGLRAFIAPFLGELQCPVRRERVDAVIDTALRAGRCLLLVDGLDEVTSEQDRVRLVQTISDFVAAHQPRGNKVVCTCRVSGYPAAPLPPEFVAVRLTEMDDVAIRRFLELYVPAIELGEAGGQHPDIARTQAQHTIDGLLEALRSTPGVRRLAANPLLLTALLLVHRTRGALPDRRVDAYKAVTDALGRAWRAAQGVPIAALPNDQDLTKWLTRLASWMHRSRPEGSATLRDLLELWGPMWAEQNHRPWDPDVLDAAEPTATDAGRAIVRFAEQIEQHCGLLVERAPRRWGFPHLTFEEYYTGRALAFEGRATIRPKTIRDRLHDPRYDEPILLALGLLGRDQPEELDAVFRAAILATGDDSIGHSLSPSAHEDVLGRDFRFALRALADNIPITPSLVDDLLARAIDELLDPDSNARFPAYRDAILDLVVSFKHLRTGTRAGELLAHRLNNGLNTSTPVRQLRLIELADRCALGPSSAVVINRVTNLATGHDPDVAIRAAELLGHHGDLPPIVSARLAEILAGKDPLAAYSASGLLAGQRELPLIVIERLTELAAGEQDTRVALRAMEVLGGQGDLPPVVAIRLGKMLNSGEPEHAIRTAAQLGGQWPAIVTNRINKMASRRDIYSVIRAAELLGAGAELPMGVIDRLTQMVTAKDSPAAIRAGDVLGGRGELPVTVLNRLTEVAAGEYPSSALAAVRVLRTKGELRPIVINRLTEIATGTDADLAVHASWALAEEAPLLPIVVSRLTEIATNGNSVASRRAAEVLSRRGIVPPAVRIHVTVIVRSKGTNAALWGASVLDDQHELPRDVSVRLTEIAARAEAGAAVVAAEMLARHGELPAAVTNRLAEIADGDSVGSFREQALAIAARTTDVTHGLLEALQRGLGDDDGGVRRTAVAGLVRIARDPAWSATIMSTLLEALMDPALAGAGRGRLDDAYDALWEISHTTAILPSPI